MRVYYDGTTSKESTKKVPAQNTTVNSVYLNMGNIQQYVRCSYREPLWHLILINLFYTGHSTMLNTMCLRTYSIAITPLWPTAMQHFDYLIASSGVRETEHTYQKLRFATCSFCKCVSALCWSGHHCFKGSPELKEWVQRMSTDTETLNQVNQRNWWLHPSLEIQSND